MNPSKAATILGYSGVGAAIVFFRPASIAYATYSAVTVASILIFGIIKYNQMPNAYGLIGIFLIIAGVLIVNLLGKVN